MRAERGGRVLALSSWLVEGMYMTEVTLSRPTADEYSVNVCMVMLGCSLYMTAGGCDYVSC